MTCDYCRIIKGVKSDMKLYRVKKKYRGHHTKVWVEIWLCKCGSRKYGNGINPGKLNDYKELK